MDVPIVVVPFGKKTCSLAFRVSFVSFGDYDECYITKHTNLVSSRKSNYFGGPSYVVLFRLYIYYDSKSLATL